MWKQIGDDVNVQEIKRFTWGVKYLDDACPIKTNEVVLVGGVSGCGKTQLAVTIAKSNAVEGKKVFYIALEAESGEITKRMIFPYLKDKYFKEFNRPFYYREWILGEYPESIRLEKEIINEMSFNYHNLNILYRTHERFGIEELEKVISDINLESDIIIIDHLHYFDIDDENENRGMKKIIKKIRDLALLYSKCIILLAHLRKKDFRDKDLAPSLFEFHGSSDIIKISTTAVTIAPYTIADMGTYNRLPTIFRCCKYRTDGSATRFYALCNYDTERGGYEEKYILGLISECRDNFTPAKKLPYWAKEANNIEI